MSYDVWEQLESPGSLFRSSHSNTKLKLHANTKLQDSATPISKLCMKMTGAILESPAEKTQPNMEPTIVHTPNTSFEHTSTETPTLIHVDSCVQTPLHTPVCVPLQSIVETPIHSLRETPLNTPQTSKVNTAVETPLCVALGKAFETKNVDSTPRRNPRRSCIDKSFVNERVKQQLKKVCVPNLFKDRPSKTNLSVQKMTFNDCQNDVNMDVHSFVENVDTFSENLGKDLSQDCRDSKSPHFRKSSCIGSAESGIPHNASDWLPSFQTQNILQNRITSEPRSFRKGNVTGCSARKLSFSSKKLSKKQNEVPEYDPDNDIFAQGLMPVQFNINSLKDQIGKFLNAADVPSPNLRRSLSCGALNVGEEVPHAPTAPLPCRRKQAKRTPGSASKATVKRTKSAPNLRLHPDTETPVTPTTSDNIRSEGKIKAFLRAREIIKNIQERSKKLLTVPSQRMKPASGNLPKSNNQVTEENLPSCSAAPHNRPSSARCMNRDSLKNPGDKDYEDLPPTQPFEYFILGDVTAYVDVISNNENISTGVKNQLMKLGATVVPSFNKNMQITHVVFNDGHISTYRKAKERNIPLVSVLWIEECRKAGVKVHEGLFPPHQIERYESPSIVKELKKRRINRFYPERMHRSPFRKKITTQNGTVLPLNKTPPQKGVVRKSKCLPKWVDDVAGDNGMVRMLVGMTGIDQHEFKEMVNRPPTPDSDGEAAENSPLPYRLLRKLAKKLPPSDSCDHTKTIVKATSTNISITENSLMKKLNEVIDNPEVGNTNQLGNPNKIESLSSTSHESHTVSQLSQSAKILSPSDSCDHTKADIVKATSTNISITENSLMKKLNEVIDNPEVGNTNQVGNPNEIESLPSTSHESHCVSQLSHSNLQNITHRKRIAKRKLLSPVEETITCSHESDDVESTVLENPHSHTPKRLSSDNTGKKRKSDNSQVDELKNSSNSKEVISARSNYEVNLVDPIRRSRRSSSYFVKPKKNSQSSIVQKPALVCTLLHTTDMDIIVSVVEKLGTFVVEKNVTAYTTHIVTEGPKRTMKLLKGMVRGCWIVTHEWVLKSLEAGKWLDEEEFELTGFSPSVQKYRLEKLSFGGIFKPDIFSTCGPIFVSSQSGVPRGDLVELILLCGGKIVSKIKKAEIAVGRCYPNVSSVSALWVLDSVQYYCCKPLDCYLCTGM